MSLSQIGKLAYFKQDEATPNFNKSTSVEGLQKLLGLINIVNKNPVEYLVIPVPQIQKLYFAQQEGQQQQQQQQQ